MYVEPWIFILLLSLFGVHLWLSTPVSSAERAEKHERWQRNREARAARKASRQASQPVFYWSAVWFGFPAAMCLLAILMGW